MVLRYGSIAVLEFFFCPPLFFSVFPSHVLPVAGEMRNEDKMVFNSAKLGRTFGSCKLGGNCFSSVGHVCATRVCRLFKCWFVGEGLRENGKRALGSVDIRCGCDASCCSRCFFWVRGFLGHRRSCLETVSPSLQHNDTSRLDFALLSLLNIHIVHWS